MNNETILRTEQRRLAIQSDLDAKRSQAERNRMGQFATPAPLALEILSYAARLFPNGERIRFLDPGFGTGAFYFALLNSFQASHIAMAVSYEIDPHYGHPALELWGGTGLSLRLEDFTKANPPNHGFNLLICNPPYVRHHHIINGEKARLQVRSAQACGVEFGGMAGLYCHFLGLSHAWMADGGIAGWLIPSEFMDVNYGEALKCYLLDKVTLLHIHRFDPHDVQFDDALVSSAVVWFRKEKPRDNHTVEFSFGGTLTKPKISRNIPATVLKKEAKWTRFPQGDIRLVERGPTISDFFSIRRGLATGDNDYFIVTATKAAERGLPDQCLRPILPSPRYLKATEVLADRFGNPLLDNPLFLLDCRLSEEEVKNVYPNLWIYFQEGHERGVSNRYLCRHRSPWYTQEKRPSAPFVCTYLGRSNVKTGRPFRFIRNHSTATVTNVYLALYPKEPLGKAMENQPAIARRVWEILNGICPKSMLDEGRVYGGGLHKLEPKELANVPVPDLATLLTDVQIVTSDQAA